MAASERCDVRRSPCGLRLRVVDDLFQPGSGLLNELLRRRIKIGNDGRFEAVSYTHLDVYKRQVWEKMPHVFQAVPVLKERRFALDRLAAFISEDRD